MRKPTAVIILVSVVFLIAMSAPLWAASSNPCENVKITEIPHGPGEVSMLKDVLANYTNAVPSLMYNKTGTKEEYYICLKLTPDFKPIIDPITFEIKDDRDIFISGLNVSSATPLLLKIVNPSNFNATVHLVNSTLIGGGADTCLEAGASNTEIDGVTIKSCSTGILVNAPGVTILNSEITNNGVGVLVADGIAGAKVLRSKVHGNTEGIVTAEEASAPIFFDGDTRDTKDIFPVSVDTPIINYADRPVYMNIPLNGSAASSENVTIEFFLSDTKESQGYDLVNKLKIDIVKEAKLLANEPEKYKIPAEHLNKPLIAIFTDPVHGTTGFSQRFTTSAGDVVAFVEAPFEMPTSGMDGAGTSGGEVEVGSGGSGLSGVTASAGPKGCGGQLVPVSHARTVDIAMAFWWILFAGAVLGGLRTAAVRVRKR